MLVVWSFYDNNNDHSDNDTFVFFSFFFVTMTIPITTVAMVLLFVIGIATGINNSYGIVVSYWHGYCSLLLSLLLLFTTGVCKKNGLAAVVYYCYSIGFSTTNNNKKAVCFANTGIGMALRFLLYACGVVVVVCYCHCFCCHYYHCCCDC